MIWSSSIHKGSGKNALKKEIDNNTLKKILDETILNKIDEIMENKFSGKIYDAKLFQIKNCRINNEHVHLSPDEVLQIVREILDENIINTDCSRGKHSENCMCIENTLIFDKSIKYHPKILYGLYMVNYIISSVN